MLSICLKTRQPAAAIANTSTHWCGFLRCRSAPYYAGHGSLHSPFWSSASPHPTASTTTAATSSTFVATPRATVPAV